LRRYWRVPAQVAGVVTIPIVLLLALPFLPDVTGRVEASSDTPPRVPGAVESLRSRGVGTPFAAPVAKIAVREGQAVKKGQLLFSMDVAPLRAQVTAARAELAAARADVASAARMRRDDLLPWE